MPDNSSKPSADNIVKTADGSNSLFSDSYNQTYHSDKGAIAESKHVFLNASGISELVETKKYKQLNILEVGFGTGLNFFLTSDLFISKDISLHYIAFEHTLLTHEVIASLDYEAHLEHTNLYHQFLDFRESFKEGVPSFEFSFENIKLTILLGNALEQNIPEEYFHAIYQDAFSPEANPELWSEPFFKSLQNSMLPDAKLTTYSVKGDIRRRLQALGFEVTKQPGPVNGKREMLVAKKIGS